ncbi:hypothetical protein A3768_1494 [Ralstonia solanacearum]|nr:hypothetical protein F504_2026 [Ralstonia pseudosolanacearum FQY_4]ANH32650.1 hypothetical protein A3768_1494 [Ralstonia solanacearum]
MWGDVFDVDLGGDLGWPFFRGAECKTPRRAWLQAGAL